MCTTLLREAKVWDGKEGASGLLGGRQQSSSSRDLWTLALVSTLRQGDHRSAAVSMHGLWRIPSLYRAAMFTSASKLCKVLFH